MQSKVTPNIQAEKRSTKGTRAAVKKLSREYRDMKNYIAYIRNKRPTLLKQAKVDLREYESRGVVTYADYVSRFPKSDRDIIETYAKCLRGVYCLEQGILSIEYDITRVVAKETLQEGRSCEAVALEMGVTRRMIEYRKKNAEQKIADFAQKYGLVSRDV